MVVVALVLVLCLGQGGLSFLHSRSDTVAERVCCLDLGVRRGGDTGVWLKAQAWEATRVGHERDLLSRGVDVVVVRELGSREKLIPVVLLVVGEKPNVLLEFLVNTLCLAVGLRVVGSGCCGCHPDKPPELPREL